jgi:predicted membrane protein
VICSAFEKLPKCSETYSILNPTLTTILLVLILFFINNCRFDKKVYKICPHFEKFTIFFFKMANFCSVWFSCHQMYLNSHIIDIFDRLEAGS